MHPVQFTCDIPQTDMVKWPPEGLSIVTNDSRTCTDAPMNAIDLKPSYKAVKAQGRKGDFVQKHLTLNNA